MSLTWENISHPLGLPLPLPLSSSHQKSSPWNLSAARHLLCFKTGNTKNSVPICHMWMCTGGPMAKAALFLVIYHTRIYTHNPCYCALEPSRDAWNGHVPACNVYFTAEFCENDTTHLESWLEVTGLNGFCVADLQSEFWLSVCRILLMYRLCIILFAVILRGCLQTEYCTCHSKKVTNF